MADASNFYVEFLSLGWLQPGEGICRSRNILARFHFSRICSAIRNTAVWAMFGTVIPPAIGLVTAALVESPHVKLKGLYRFLFFLPYFFSMAVAAAIFARVYDPSYGMINQLLQAVGLGNIQPQWLGDSRLALPAAISVYIWHEIGFCYIVFTAAIQQIDQDMLDAASVDGASGLQTFWNITIPTVRSIINFVMMVMLIGGLTPFAVIFALDTRGGPYYATEVFPSLIHKQGLMGNNASEAAALGVVLLVIVLTVVMIFSGCENVNRNSTMRFVMRTLKTLPVYAILTVILVPFVFPVFGD
jgi:ABC-type sugar transport system permease subunit